MPAPVLLVVLRLVQGFGVGGEWGGAALMALEHSDENKRGFSASFANMGAPAGAVLSTVVLAIVTLLPGDAFLVWGWRIPFLLSLLSWSVSGSTSGSSSPSRPCTSRKSSLLSPSEKTRLPIVDVLPPTPRPCCWASAPASAPSRCRP